MFGKKPERQCESVSRHGVIHTRIIRHLQSLCQEWDKTYAFWLARNLNIVIWAISTTLPRKASFRRMTSEGEARQIMKNIRFVLWVLSTEMTWREFTVLRYETRRSRKHRTIKWKLEQLTINLNATFSADALKDSRLLIPTMGTGDWLRN